MYKGCATLQAAIEVATAFHQAHYSAKYRSAYQSSGVTSAYSDRRVDQSPMELDSVQPGQAARKWKKQPEARSSQTQKCYRCQKNGHRAFECRADTPIPSQQQQQCNKPGGQMPHGKGGYMAHKKLAHAECHMIASISGPLSTQVHILGVEIHTLLDTGSCGNQEQPSRTIQSAPGCVQTPTTIPNQGCQWQYTIGEDQRDSAYLHG